MKRSFNVTGSCNPQRHYMVRLDDRLEKIREDYVEGGSYFVINRGRQYGKTTTLAALEEALKDDYVVLSIDFQQMGTEDFANASTFAHAFANMLIESLEMNGLGGRAELTQPLTEVLDRDSNSLKELFMRLSRMCKNSTQPVILMIDEVDSASNNQVFVDFLAQLRGYYLKRDKMPIFHSVILAGVYSIKNLKLKLRAESQHQYNSPWNIAAEFEIEMRFSSSQIAAMLTEYEADHHTGMNIAQVAEQIYQYTAGYPVLVSTICQKIDEKILKEEAFENPGSAWTSRGIEEAVRRILFERTPLFESMIRHLDDYPEMKQMFQEILFQGKAFSFNLDTKEISLAAMFGYAVSRNGKVQVANRIFETRLYNYFLSENELARSDSANLMGDAAARDRNCFVHDGMLDMDASSCSI